jgi:hypothetical protein
LTIVYYWLYLLIYTSEAAMTKIKVFYRTVYGRTLYYPYDEMAKTLARLMQVKSFTVEQIATIGGSGLVEVERVSDPSIT